MHILIASATYNEVNSTIEWLSRENGRVHDHEIEVLITGIGGAATSHALTRKILNHTPEMVIQAGIGGSFKEEYPPESVVFIKEEIFADLGAFEDDGFSDIFDLGLKGIDEHPFSKRLLVNKHISKWERFSLPFVRGATINCISSTPFQVRAISQKYDPDIESMEGAALHYTCIKEEVPFIQLRAVSNYVGERDKRIWKMREAIDRLNKTLREMLAT